MIGGLSSISSGGGKPEGKEGVQYSHVRGRKIHRISYMMYLIHNSYMDKLIFPSDKLKRIMIIYS